MKIATLLVVAVLITATSAGGKPAVSNGKNTNKISSPATTKQPTDVSASQEPSELALLNNGDVSVDDVEETKNASSTTQAPNKVKDKGNVKKNNAHDENIKKNPVEKIAQIKETIKVVNVALTKKNTNKISSPATTKQPTDVSASQEAAELALLNNGDVEEDVEEDTKISSSTTQAPNKVKDKGNVKKNNAHDENIKETIKVVNVALTKSDTNVTKAKPVPLVRSATPPANVKPKVADKVKTANKGQEMNVEIPAHNQTVFVKKSG